MACKATFTSTIRTSSLLELDATGSTGALTWEINGVQRPETTTHVSYGPLKLGTHHVKLTATSAPCAATLECDIDVPWIGAPFDQAQHDGTNGLPGGGLTLPQWNPLPPIGPWRNKQVLNEAQQAPPGDGIPRIIPHADGTCDLITKYGDHPGTTGGYRSAMEFNNSYDGTLAGQPLGVADLDLCGDGNADGHSGVVRYYRVRFMLPTTNPNPLLYQNNVFEIHGNTGGSAPVRIAPNGAGTQLGVVFQQCVNGVNGPQLNFDFNTILYGTWYDYTIELLLDVDPAKGYVRVYRNGTLVTKVPAGTQPDGRLFAATQQTDTTGAVIPMAIDCQNYRTKVGMPSTYPDATITYKPPIVAAQLATVQAYA